MSIDLILEELERVHEKLDRLLVKRVEKDWSLLEGASEQPTDVEPKKILTTVTTNFALPVTGKYQWYRFADREGKVRACTNQGCGMFLLWNPDKKKYEHWKYDVNTGKGGYVQDNCDLLEVMG